MSIEDAARDDAVLEVLDAELGAALVGVDVGAGVAVVGLLLVEDVAERVDVAVRVAVVLDRVAVHVVAAQHRVLERAGVVVGLLGQQDVRERHRLAGLDERDRLLPLRRRDQVDRAELIVRPPAAPVLDLLEQRVELGGVARRAAMRGGASSAPTAAAPTVDVGADLGRPGDGRDNISAATAASFSCVAPQSGAIVCGERGDLMKKVILSVFAVPFILAPAVMLAQRHEAHGGDLHHRRRSEAVNALPGVDRHDSGSWTSAPENFAVGIIHRGATGAARAARPPARLRGRGAWRRRGSGGGGPDAGRRRGRAVRRAVDGADDRRHARRASRTISRPRAT